MGKVSPKDRDLKTAKKNRRLKSSSSKYLKPGTLAQLRHSKVSAAKLCTDLGKKRVAVLSSKKQEDDNLLIENMVAEKIPLMLSPMDLLKQSSMTRTPKTPRPEDFESESRLESLPMDLLVKILCHLHHDQLRAVFHVSQRIRRAVCLARQFHFNYTTPDRSRQEMLSTMTPRVTEHWPFLSKGDGKSNLMGSPHTPKAPRQGPRPPSRIKVTELRQIAAVLFQDSGFPSRCMVPSVLPKPLCKSLASNRVLFYEDELCQAVAQNKLR
ncbi:hypothetical protein E1A91_D11G195200v1 [Gossypium mustelinum]|uniref:F-box domain-containing protein n=3 Tax=Gossypium TaxID=3633 RepID=A0A5D2SUX8_GOSMU|nr:hypothetical protein ES288_D11G200900v1 [Gossypium darwinii]TYH44492.1 hypothetical protein ES332_D11G198300v1 [Gossypium tomentosum]TYI56233.1 hypothetical protein E1A91_D11G195200v1 [Gossypium mustelinum]